MYFYKGEKIAIVNIAQHSIRSHLYKTYERAYGHSSKHRYYDVTKNTYIIYNNAQYISLLALNDVGKSLLLKQKLAFQDTNEMI